MERISAEAYRALLDDAEVLSRDGYGEKVVRRPDGLLIKAFRLKRPWSSGRWKSYAVRFAENAERLRALGVPTVSVERVVHCVAQKRHLVFYRPLAGATLRDLLQTAPPGEVTRLLLDFAGFLTELHGHGVYFRSIHFGNVVLTEEDGRFGLIDVADMRFHARALSPALRARNFHHLTRYEVDCKALRTCGAEAFLNAYLARADLQGPDGRKFVQQLQRDLPIFSTSAVGTSRTTGTSS